MTKKGNIGSKDFKSNKTKSQKVWLANSNVLLTKMAIFGRGSKKPPGMNRVNKSCWCRFSLTGNKLDVEAVIFRRSRFYDWQNKHMCNFKSVCGKLLRLRRLRTESVRALFSWGLLISSSSSSLDTDVAWRKLYWNWNRRVRVPHTSIDNRSIVHD